MKASARRTLFLLLVIFPTFSQAEHGLAVGTAARILLPAMLGQVSSDRKVTLVPVFKVGNPKEIEFVYASVCATKKGRDADFGTAPKKDCLGYFINYEELKAVLKKDAKNPAQVDKTIASIDAQLKKGKPIDATPGKDPVMTQLACKVFLNSVNPVRPGRLFSKDANTPDNHPLSRNVQYPRGVR